MRSPILLLPTLLLVCCALVLAASPNASQIPATQASRDAEIGHLQQQLDAASARLAQLQGSGHNFLPR